VCEDCDVTATQRDGL